MCLRHVLALAVQRIGRGTTVVLDVDVLCR